MVRKHVLDVGPVLDVHDEVVARVDVVVLPEVDQVDDLAVNHHGGDKVHGPCHGRV
jgi:hypothetical protein